MSLKFSIIIPVYNAEKYLRPCLDSVLAQTVKDWECICVDDGSTDGSGQILDEYAKEDVRFISIHQFNQGVAVARNVGLDIAKGEWITWLDADDLYAPWRLEEAGKIIDEESPDVVRFRTAVGSVAEQHEFSKGNHAVIVGTACEDWNWNVMLPAGMLWTLVMRKSLLDGVRFTPNMRIKEEFPVCAQLALRIKKAVQSESKAYFYRQTETSAMHSLRSYHDCLRVLNAIGLFCHENPVLPMMAKRRLRMHCECDIIDWILMQKEGREGTSDIYRQYNELKSYGLFNCRSIQSLRYRLPMWWWDKTAQTWPIKLVHSFISIVRSLVGGHKIG